MDISIVIPLLNEEESLPELMNWIDKVMSEHKFSYEVLFVDDGSTDDSWKVIQTLSNQYNTIKAIRFRRNYGKSAALNTGFSKAEGDVVFTMDADLQDSPEELPQMYATIMKGGADLVSGWKKKRFDPLSKTIPTKIYNWATRKMSGINLNDFNCGLKGYRNEVVKHIEVYGEMHRYIPVLAKQAGYKKIEEQVVQHQARKFGTTKFGLNRFIRGPLDLLSIIFVSRYGKRPMHFFGTLGVLLFALGALLTVYLGGEKLYFVLTEQSKRLVTDSPFFYLALTTMIIGTQLFLAGFLGELISRNNVNRNLYEIKEYLRL